MTVSKQKTYLAIANLYLYCFDTLRSLVESYSGSRKGTPEAEKCEEQLRRLKEWNNKANASSGNLDHSLRCNQELRSYVISLFHQLYDSLEKAKATGINTTVDESPKTEAQEDAFIHVGSETSFQSSIAEQFVGTRDIISQLQRLLPALDQSAFTGGNQKSNEVKARFDTNHFRHKFPLANGDLIKNLGIAGWNRRQHLMSLISSSKVTQSRPGPQVAFSESYEENPPIISFKARSRNNDESDSADKTSVTSATKSTPIPHEPKSTTELTKASSYTDGRSEPAPKGISRYLLPLPPTEEQRFDGSTFECPYCSLLVNNMVSPKVWRHHVMTDLEPYMCTHLGCVSPTRTYRTNDAWFDHELKEHLLTKYWECQICQNTFDVVDELRDHYNEDHAGTFNSRELEYVVNACEKFRDTSLTDLTCPLCQESGMNADTFRKHVGDELEQLALFSFGPDYQSFSIDTDLKDLSAADLESLEKIFSPGILENPLEQPEIIAQIRAQPKAEPESVELEQGDVPQDIEKPTMLREMPVTHRARNREAACDFPLNTVTRDRDPDFFKRPSILSLQTIHETFVHPGRNVCVIHGRGGVGKSLLALEYAYEFASAYDARFWLFGEGESSLMESVRKLADDLKLGLDGTEDDSEILNIAKKWLEETERPWLAIVDNLEDWNDIRRALPPNVSGRNGTVIITTRRPELAHHGSMAIELPLLTRAEGGQMLLHYFRNMEPDDTPEEVLAEELATLVGGLAISIGLTAKYIVTAPRPIREAEELGEIFEATLAQARTTMSEGDSEVGSKLGTLSYEETLKVVCDFFQRELPRHSRDLVNILAYLASDAIPKSMIWTVHEDPLLRFLNPNIPHKEKRTSKALLASRFVQEVTIEEQIYYMIHREIQRSLRNNLRDDGRLDVVFHQAVKILMREFPEPSPIQVPEESKWPEYKRLLPHVTALREIFMEENKKMPGTIAGSRDLVIILCDAGINQWDQGVNSEGLANAMAADEILEKHLKDDYSPQKADVDVLIGCLMEKGISQRRDAIKRRINVLKLRKRFAIEGPPPDVYEEIKLFNAHSDLAFSLLEYNDYGQAEKLFDICSKKYTEWEKAGSQEKLVWEWAKYHNAMASIRMLQGRYEEAEYAAQQAMKLTGVMGNRSGMLKWKFLLASIYLQKGDIKKALKTHTEVMEERKERAGMYNEFTLESCYAVGAIHELEGRYEVAEKYFRESLTGHRTAGWCEEGVARSKYHLANVMLKRKKPEQDTAKLFQESREVLNRLLPADRPAWLDGETNEVILFDHLRCYQVRFTGVALLKRFQAHYNPKMDILVPYNIDDLVVN